MRTRRLIGLFLIVMSITQVFISLNLQATYGHRRGVFYILLVSLMCTAGVALLSCPSGARLKARDKA